MIRIERKNTPKAQLAIADLQKAYKSGGTYNTDNVNAALIRKELKDSSAFTAFKRWLIWDNEIYSELEKYIPEN